jgi:ABC-2 type transport system permease protein
MSAGVLSDALRAEWTKLRTDPGAGAALLALVVLTIGLSVVTVGTASCPATGCAADPAKVSLTGVDLGLAVAAVLGVLVIGGEYSTRMVSVSMAAMPARGAVLAAKAVVLGAVMLVASTIAVLGCFLAGRLALPGKGFSPAHGYPELSLTHGPVLRAVLGCALYLTLIALLGLGVAAMVRDPAAATGVVLGVLYVLPILTAVVSDKHWRHRLEQASPLTAGLSVQSVSDLHALPIGPWHGLGVVALWAATALAGGWAVLRLRDV